MRCALLEPIAHAKQPRPTGKTLRHSGHSVNPLTSLHMTHSRFWHIGHTYPRVIRCCEHLARFAHTHFLHDLSELGLRCARRCHCRMSFSLSSAQIWPDGSYYLLVLIVLARLMIAISRWLSANSFAYPSSPLKPRMSSLLARCLVINPCQSSRLTLAMFGELLGHSLIIPSTRIPFGINIRIAAFLYSPAPWFAPVLDFLCLGAEPLPLIRSCVRLRTEFKCTQPRVELQHDLQCFFPSKQLQELPLRSIV